MKHISTKFIKNSAIEFDSYDLFVDEEYKKSSFTPILMPSTQLFWTIIGSLHEVLREKIFNCQIQFPDEIREKLDQDSGWAH
ncbi:hypothetical protein DK846_15265 [Methanospirillum lacunae]|uniref:Uncharacterized protein n=1 Tax=Methanospirillum lacunae TaxID=668570 RepID=A0A2V2MXI5_9EURY|nr:hypothetical protein DK846_15265 [Methanospirillum lacunae]